MVTRMKASEISAVNQTHTHLDATASKVIQQSLQANTWQAHLVAHLLGDGVPVQRNLMQLYGRCFYQKWLRKEERDEGLWCTQAPCNIPLLMAAAALFSLYTLPCV